MKIVISARETASGHEFEVVSTGTDDHSYEAFKEMYVELTDWMSQNADKFRKPKAPKPEPVIRRPEPKTVTHKIQYKDIKKVMEGISLLREQTCHSED